MHIYKPRKLRPYVLLAFVLRGVNYLLGYWLLLLIAAFFLSPVGPHLRIQYTYTQGPFGERSYVACDYLGSRGMIAARFGDQCPVLAIIDARRRN